MKQKSSQCLSLLLTSISMAEMIKESKHQSQLTVCVKRKHVQ